MRGPADHFRTRVRATIAAALRIGPDDLPPNAEADTVERWDSLGHLEIIDRISKTFGVEIDHAEAVQLLDEEALTAFVMKRARAGRASLRGETES
jgi:acyl carrier protein